MYNHRTGAYLIISNSPIIKKNIYRKTNYEKMQYRSLCLRKNAVRIYSQVYSQVLTLHF